MSSLYKYISAEGAIKTLEKSQLKFSHPLSFNDPMDVRRSICHEFLNVHTLSSTFRRRFLDLILDDSYNPSLCLHPDLRKIIVAARQMCITEGADRFVLENAFDRDYFFELAEKACSPNSQVELAYNEKVKRTCVCCFSTLHPSDDKPGAPSQLMWAHYASQHAGVALGFDCVGDFCNKIKQVRYSDELPNLISEETAVEYVFGLGNSPYSNMLVESLFFTKSSCWEYESEWRIVAYYDGPREKGALEPMEPRSLTSIYVGYRCSPENRARILDLAHNYPWARLYDVDIQPRSFKLSARNISL